MTLNISILYFFIPFHYTEYMKVLVTVILFLVLSVSHAHAASEFSVSPPIIELKQQTQTQITLKNTSEEEITISYRFQVLRSDTQGILTPIQRKTIPDSMSIMGTDTDTTIVIAPNTSRTLTLSYTPSEARENNILGLEFVNAPKTTPTDRTASKIESSIIIPLIISYPNAYSELSNIVFTAPFFIGNNTVSFDIKAKNTGENPLKVQGQIVIRNILRNTVESFEISPKYLLAGHTRTFLSIDGKQITWDPSLLIGFYQAELQLQYENKEVIKRHILVGIPVKQTVFLILAGIIASGIYLRVKKYR